MPVDGTIIDVHRDIEVIIIVKTFLTYNGFTKIRFGSTSFYYINVYIIKKSILSIGITNFHNTICYVYQKKISDF